MTFAEAAHLIARWGEPRIKPLITPSAEPLDLSLDDECSAFSRWLSEDPERDLEAAAPMIVRLFWARLLFIVSTCERRPDYIFGRVPGSASNEEVMRALLAGPIALTTLPSEWREGPPGGWPC
jgi:hypothetical protein